jgi:hypothetical protein
MNYQPEDIRLEMTCGACPEQYDAFVGDRQVGYLRVRHGYFRVKCPDSGGISVYATDTIGDGLFDSSERDLHLSRAKQAIWKHEHPEVLVVLDKETARRIWEAGIKWGDYALHMGKDAPDFETFYKQLIGTDGK